MPPSLQVWTAALSRLDTNPGRARLCGASDSKTARGYVLPNPMLFFGTSLEKRNTFFYNWLRYRSALLHRITDWRNPPLSSQMWRDFLHLSPDSSSQPAPPAASHSSTSSRPTKSSHHKEILRDMLKLCTENSDSIHLLDSFDPRPEVHWKAHKFAPDDIYDTISSQEIIWELAELNFRAKLRSLDQHLHHHNQDPITPFLIANYSREDEILFCLANSQSTGIFVADIKMAGSGIAAADWMIRRPYVLALQHVMSTWDGFQQAAQRSRVDITVKMSVVLNYPEHKFLEFENSIVPLYIQFFFDCFDCPPTLRRLDQTV